MNQSETSPQHATNDIVCPGCNKAFTVDMAGCADNVRPVRIAELERELRERLALAEADKLAAIKLAEAKATGQREKTAAANAAGIHDLMSGMGRAELEEALGLQSLKVTYEAHIKDRGEVIEPLKDLKKRLMRRNFIWREVWPHDTNRVVHQMVDAEGTLRGTVTETRGDPWRFGPWEWEIVEHKPTCLGQKVGPANSLLEAIGTVQQALWSLK